MNYKKTNISYLIMVIASILFSVGYSTLYSRGIITEISISASNFICEMANLLPAVVMILITRDKFSGLIPFRRIKISSFLLIILYTFLLFPLVSLVNSISMLFVDNTMVAVSDSIVSMPMWMMFLSIGLFGPFVEEVVFRGVILHSFQRTGKIVASIILSSVMFGVMHLNFNQFAYAAIIGIMFSLLVEATGSVLASFTAHALFNSTEVLIMFASADVLSESEEAMSQMTGGVQYLTMIFALALVALIFTAIAVCLVVKISKIEGRLEFFAGIPHKKSDGPRLVTVPLVLAFVVGVAWMVFTEIIA